MSALADDLLRIAVLIAALTAIILALSGRRLARRALEDAQEALSRLPPHFSPQEPQLIEGEVRAFAGAVGLALVSCAIALAITVALMAIFGGGRL